MVARLDPNRILRHGLTAEEISLYFLYRSKCDLCDKVFLWGWEREGRYGFHIDHDHKHCAWSQGCPECVRGFLCTSCNMIEGTIVKAMASGFVTSLEGRLAQYWADPPFQRWRRRGPTRFGKQHVARV